MKSKILKIVSIILVSCVLLAVLYPALPERPPIKPTVVKPWVQL